jgi:hypothetical protein
LKNLNDLKRYLENVMRNKFKTLAVLVLATTTLMATKPINAYAEQKQSGNTKQLTVRLKKPKNIVNKLFGFDYWGIGFNWGVENHPGAISHEADYQSEYLEILGGSYLNKNLPVLPKIIDRYEFHLEAGRHEAKLRDRTKKAYPIMLTLWMYKDFNIPQKDAKAFIGAGSGVGYMDAENYPALGNDPFTGNFSLKLGTRFEIGKKGNKGTFFLTWDHNSKPFQQGENKQYIGHEGDVGVNTLGAGVTYEFD